MSLIGRVVRWFDSGQPLTTGERIILDNMFENYHQAVDSREGFGERERLLGVCNAEIEKMKRAGKDVSDYQLAYHKLAGDLSVQKKLERR